MTCRTHPLRWLRVSAVAVLWVAPAAVTAQDGPLADKPLAGKARQAFIASVAKSMARAPVVAARFEQEKHYALFDGVVRHRGFILYQRPDRLRWEIEHPFRSILIVAGTDVAKFEFRKGERRKLDLGRARDLLLVVMDQIRTWFRGEFEKTDADYAVEFFAGDAEKGLPARIELVPKSKALRKTVQAFELELAADLGSVTCVTIREAGGDKTVMRFRALPAGQRVTAGHFDVDDPRDFTASPPRPASRRTR